jgi:hypothetical protein
LIAGGLRVCWIAGDLQSARATICSESDAGSGPRLKSSILSKRLRTMIRLISYFLVTEMTVLCLAGCGRQNVPTSFSLSGPNQISKPGQPFTTYTVVTRQGGNREFVYFMVIKPPEAPNGVRQQTSSSQSSSIGRNGQAKSKINLNGKEVTVEYKMTVRPDGTLETESFAVGGKNQSFDKGRVFLVDLSTEPIRILPHDMTLSTTIPDLLNPTAIETVAESALKELEKDPAIAEFTRPLR